MALVRPFRAIRYSTTSRDVTQLTSPPYDVIGEAQRTELLRRDAHNIVALELPEGTLDPDLPGNRYETGARRWTEWLAQGVLAKDERPGIYVLEQRWVQDGRSLRRSAFIAAVGLERFEDRVILPHERTLPKALDDRLNLTRACAANFSQVFALYSDPEFSTSAMFEAAMRAEPLAYALGEQGVESRLWALTDEESLGRVERVFRDRQVFIADGHHRYTTALAYRDERRAAPGAVGKISSDELGSPSDVPPYDFVLMALANMDDPDLVVLPTHRVADAPRDFDIEAFWSSLTENFDVTPLPEGRPSNAPIEGERPRFVVQTADGQRRLATLRPEVDLDSVMAVPYSSAWKHLDVAVLQELVLSPLLDIHPDRPHTLERLTFVKDAQEALDLGREHDVVFILRATRLQQLREVALAGEIMPQKSTYFYPKVLSGLAMRSLA